MIRKGSLSPDDLFASNLSGETFFYTIKGNLFTGYSQMETHGKMLSSDPSLFYECFPDSQKCFKNKEEIQYFLNRIFSNLLAKKKFLKNKNLECFETDSLDIKVLKYLLKKNIDMDLINDFNASFYPRYKAIMFGNILGRYATYGKNCFISLWNAEHEINPNLLKKLFNDQEFINQLKVFFKNFPSSDWTVVFDKVDFRNFEELSNFRYEPKIKVKKNKKTIKNGQDTREIDLNTKIKILDQEFTISQLQTMRSNMHVGSKFPDPTIPLHPSQYFKYLCAVDTKKYPQLTGYRPVNCPSNKNIKYEPTMRDVMRKAGYHYYGTYGESFKNWLKSIE